MSKDAALEKAWILMKARYTGMDGNRTRERRGECREKGCSAMKTWDQCGLNTGGPYDQYAFECNNWTPTE